ncbi:HlyD family efflux transporter periplasmic adaptor subunit [Vibrio europaeus]|uniref:Secretion protein n=2 Tax=Vibrio oreintalis group TaxID=1891919 RepID=F9TB28_9VIBR|nr:MULTISPECIES: HlyD family efflux transporter periplasmic adaptor subunit [Vibrio oreintalis group]AIW17230.1 secretion protein [Vibrio tubiashii ATCC 19109]EGU49450.1 secretion protein [Vibrio tubiashii ATCC 19109]EIF05009.1 secretion protein [Vibrio tubiashii NCIMB 1337 = ATCC 19106]MDC5721760.1 HlyD family efflux transporter periplasmic adaptor subunit [Vibrio europaeus]MDC5758150.1 HlyD family efflux transporter periplasmic adaptor subunit [Vibrio europaeus]
MSLFRNEVTERQHGYYGDILIALPPTFTRLIALTSLVGIVVVAFTLWGEFSQKEKVQGLLLPKGGIADVFAPESGLISQRLVEEGQRVTRGQALYVINTESTNPTDGDLRQHLGALMNKNVELVKQQVAANETLTHQKQQALEREIRQLAVNAEGHRQVIALKKQQLKLAQETLASFVTKQQQQTISKIELRQRRSDMLAIEADLQQLQLQLDDFRYQKTQKQAEIKQLGSQLTLERAQLQRRVGDVQQQLATNNALKETVVPSPFDGTVSALNVSQGPVSQNSVLLSIIPEGQALQAVLFVPSRAVGFLSVGQSVRLQYEAFPYQKFGQYEGVIDAISSTTVAVDDLKYQPPSQAKTPLPPFVYLVKVTLRSQSVDVYGVDTPLRAGMNLEASLEVERRKIYQWLLDPFKKVQEYM